jgi:hypothetical protein
MDPFGSRKRKVRHRAEALGHQLSAFVRFDLEGDP